METKIQLLGDKKEEVNFQITQNVELITLTDGYKYIKQGFRVSLSPDAEEGGTISAKLRNGSDEFITIPIFIGGWNDYIISEINTSGHSLETLYIGY